MDSVNRNVIQQRVARVYDTCAGAQGLENHIKKYTKALLNSVGMEDGSAGNAEDFFKDFGKGL